MQKKNNYNKNNIDSDEQYLTPSQILLIKETRKSIIEYCENNNIKLSILYADGMLENTSYHDSEELFVFTITNNKNNYLFTIQKEFENIILKIKIKHNDEHQIALHNKDDFYKILKYIYI